MRRKPDGPPQVLRHETDAVDHRVDAYPDLSEQVGALVKMAGALRDQGLVLPQEMLDLIDKCEGIKARFPKPAAPPATEDESSDA